MKRTLVVLGMALCALPARGADPTPCDPPALALIDELPTKDDITQMFDDPIAQLREHALSATVDQGVQIRAIRALPLFCTPTCKQLGTNPPHPARDAVLDVIAETVRPEVPRSGRAAVKLRAAIEALGLIRSGAQADVDVLAPFLGHPSRDIRVTTARALGNLCHPGAIAPLNAHQSSEQIAQVGDAIQDALDVLSSCTPP